MPFSKFGYVATLLFATVVLAADDPILTPQQTHHQQPASDNFDRILNILDRYGWLALFCLYLVLRGEKKLDKNTNAVLRMASAIDRSNRINATRLMASPHIAPEIKAEAAMILEETDKHHEA